MKMGLKESKKYAIGSIHENGGGKFEILRRWYEESNDAIMLEYKFLEDGRVESNKEVNVNASEWKWRRHRGLATNASHIDEQRKADTDLNWEELVEGVYVRLEKLITENREGIEDIKAEHYHQSKVMTEMLSVIRIQQKQIDTLVKDNQIINKLLEKI